MINYFINNSKLGSFCFSDSILDISSFINTLSNVFYIIDESVYKYYYSCFHINSYNSYIIKSGELSKNIYIYNLIIDKLMFSGCCKITTIVSIGGGVTGDLSGFVASTFYRGVDLVHIPTTLLSQVDSSIGGKTAINTKFGKNLIGSYYHPKYVLICTSFLVSLDNYYYIMGLSEIIKSAIIFDKNFYIYIYSNYNNILNRSRYILKYIIKKSILLKFITIKHDERELLSLRYKLNLGHTYAHSIEKSLNYNINHGSAVYYGIIFTSIISLCNSNLTDILNILKLTYLLNPYIYNNILRFNIRYLHRNISYDKKKLDFLSTSFIIIKKIGSVNIKPLNINCKNIMIKIIMFLKQIS
ncbi:3-dehydroquinate synthase [Candidatus Vidania fulgoroideorum]